MSEQFVLLSDASGMDHLRIGGKAANLKALSAGGFPVPPGFVITTDVYERHLDRNGIRDFVRKSMEQMDAEYDRSVAEHSEQIKRKVLAGALEEGFETAVRRTLESIDLGATWAVRSSAVLEDLPDASFAGQQDTYLNVRTEDVPERIRRCWASYWNARAISYRNEANADHLAQGIAVVVQKMLRPKCAGVVFTADPVRDRKNTIVIESSWGLGEAIVSGIVSPDRFECDKKSLSLRSRSVAKKTVALMPGEDGTERTDLPPEKQVEPSLTDDEVRRLAEMGRTIEAKFGMPQDIEWAIEGERVFVLQTRAITTMVSDEETLWTRGYGDEYWADVTSPLFFSLLGEYLTKYVNHEGSKILGYKGIVGKDLLKVHKGHIYFNSAVLEEVFTYNPRFSRTKELLNYFPERDQERIASAPTKIVPRVLSELRVAVLDPDGLIIRTDKAYKEWTRRFLDEMRSFDQKDLSALTYPELRAEFDRMEKALLKHYRLIRYGMVTHSIGMNLMIKRWLKDWLHDDDGVLYSRLVSGLQNNMTIRTNVEIERLAKAARANPAVMANLTRLSSGEFVKALESDPGTKEFATLFARFLASYGHRSHTREMYFPRWSDDPRLVVDALKALATSPRLNLEDLEKKRALDRMAAEREVLTRISELESGFVKKILFKTVMRYAQTYLMFRENQRFYLDHQIARWRRLFIEYGRRFVRDGLSAKEDDIFFLSKEEIFDSASGKLRVDKTELQDRKSEFNRYRNILPPKFLKGRYEFDDSIEREGNVSRIVGTSASPGTVTGIVRVIESIDRLSEVRENEILVTTNTDPGWTSVFAKLGGLITETGGILSHGAVVSREYGIPAVTAVKDATSILKTGQTVTLDGGDGVLYIRENAEHADTDVVHEFGNHPDWNESFYFNFYDKKQDICGFMRIGLKPNRDEKSMFFFIMMPDGALLSVRDAERFKDVEFNVKGLRYRKIEPERRWSIDYHGGMARDSKDGGGSAKVSMMLEFEGLHPLFNYRECVTGEKVEMSKTAASEHTEQYGRVRGRLVIDESQILIDALGERDHSWGVRDWIAPTMWIWLTAQFPDGVAMNLTKLMVEEGVVDAGFLFMNGKNLPIVEATVDTKYTEDGSPSSLNILLRDKEGVEHGMKAEVIRRVKLPFVGSGTASMAIMHETLARYEFEGATGFGIAEYLVRKF